MLTKITSLSKDERDALECSGIVRQNKTFQLNWCGIFDEVPDYWLNYVPKVISDLSITVDLFNEEKNKNEKLVDLIIRLPEWFDKGKVSIAIYDVSSMSDFLN